MSMRLWLKYLFGEYKFDMLAGITTFVVAIFPLRFYDDPKPILIWTALSVVIGTFVIVYLRARHRRLYFIPLTRESHRYNWVGRGDFKFDRVEKCFQITNADPGYIYPNCTNWTNYKYRFEFRINNLNFGAIVRARDLSNYAMIQFREAEIKPHLRLNGMWFDIEAIAPLPYVDEKTLQLSKWYTCILTCVDNTIYINLRDSDDDILFKGSWPIPNLQQYALPLFQYDAAAQGMEEGGGLVRFVINLEYGSIGVRAIDQENALVKNIWIEEVH